MKQPILLHVETLICDDEVIFNLLISSIEKAHSTTYKRRAIFKIETIYDATHCIVLPETSEIRWYKNIRAIDTIDDIPNPSK